MPRSVAVLPQAEQHQLQTIRASGDLPALRQRVLALRQAEWPLRAIGEPLEAPRSTVRMWEQGADSSAPLPDVPECERAERSRGERVIRMRPDVPVEDREQLRELAETARLVRGRTPSNSPQRISANQLDEMILTYISRGVPIKRIADHMGVTPRAVTARHERYLARQAKQQEPAA